MILLVDSLKCYVLFCVLKFTLFNVFVAVVVGALTLCKLINRYFDNGEGNDEMSQNVVFH